MPEADDLKLRAELLLCIGRVVRARGLTEKEAGRLMEMDRPHVSALIAGKVGEVSIDQLIRALRDLGQDIEVRIAPSAHTKGELRIAI